MLLGTIKLKPGALESLPPHFKTFGPWPSIGVDRAHDVSLEPLFNLPSVDILESFFAGFQIQAPFLPEGDEELDPESDSVPIIIVIEGDHLVGSSANDYDLSGPTQRCGPGDVILYEGPHTPWFIPSVVPHEDGTYSIPHCIFLMMLFRKSSVQAAIKEIFELNNGRVHRALLKTYDANTPDVDRRLKPVGGLMFMRELSRRIGIGLGYRERKRPR